MKKLPNFITICRLVIVPILIYFLYNEKFLIAFILFAIAATTDVLDGYLARKYKTESNFGKIVDPLADKLLQLSSVIVLYLIGKLSLIFVILLFAKEILIVVGGILLYKKNFIIPSKWYGKVASTLLNTSIAASIIFKISNIFINIIIGISILFALFALVKYYLNYLEISKNTLESTSE